MWISQHRYDRLIERIERLEKGPVMDFYVSGYSSYQFSFAMKTVIEKILQHLNLKIEYKSSSPADIVLSEIPKPTFTVTGS